MKAKLIKDSDGYWLDISDDGITKRLLTDFGQLSIKNCEAIANGYDLDELANRAFDNMGYHSTVTPHEEKQFKLGYRVAFREALELLGDKKFSEEDISKAIDFGVHVEAGNIDIDYKRYGTKENQFIRSLQQTEFDVEVEMTEDWYDGFKSKPKLDKDGCLILKRI